MSKKESSGDVDLSQYRSTEGVSTKTANVSGDDHPIKSRFGNKNKAFEFDAEIIAQRIADWYSDGGAAIREFLSNAETACIRRAKMELESRGESVPNEVDDLLAKANDVAGYEPQIEITYRAKSDEPRLTIEDNGCGIDPEEYQVLRNIGYSASHDSGERLGQFGMGILSFAQLTGTRGAIQLSTRSFPSVDHEETSYSLLLYVTNPEYLDGTRDRYGTRFDFPDFTDTVDLDVTEKVNEYARGMRVPVLYRHFDASGEETPESDEYLPTSLADGYNDNAPVFTVENEFFEAAMSPEEPYDRDTGYVTYNVTMPIRRNTNRYGTNNEFSAEWPFDFRGKREDGPIVKCESDPSLVGLVEVDDSKYEDVNDPSEYVPASEVPDDAISMPEPSSSRDSYMSGYDDFWQYVSEQLQDEFRRVSAERFASLDSWGTFLAMDRSEKKDVFRAYSVFGLSYSETEPETIQDHLEEEMDVTVPEEVCKRLHASKKMIRKVEEGHLVPHTKCATSKKKIWKIINDSSDGVYMGKSISKKKAEIAWGLGDTTVVQVEGSARQKYEYYESLFGFEKLKDLPTSNLSEKLPELDDDVAAKWEDRSSSGTSSSTTGSRRTSRNPESKRITLRVGKRRSKYIDDTRASRVKSRLERGDTISVNRYSCDALLLYDQTELSGSTAPTKHAEKGVIAVSAVPNYVYEWLKDVDNVYTDVEAFAQARKQEERDTYDNGETVIFASDSLYDKFEGSTDELVDLIEEHTNTTVETPVTLFEECTGNITYNDADDFDADTLAVNGGYGTRGFCENDVSLNLTKIKLQERFPDADFENSDYAYRIFNGTPFKQTPGRNSYEKGCEILEALGGTFPDQ